MANINLPVDHQTTPTVTKKTRMKDSVHHADAVSTNPDQQQKQSSQQQEKPPQQKNTAPAPPIEHKTDDPKSRELSSRGENRRQHNRRQQDQHVLLDTRSGHDRRKSAGQRKEDIPGQQSSFGIDTKA